MQVVLCWLKENCEAKASSAQTLKFIMLVLFFFSFLFYLCLCINNLIFPFLYLYFVHCAVGNSIIVVTLCPKLDGFNLVKLMSMNLSIISIVIRSPACGGWGSWRQRWAVSTVVDNLVIPRSSTGKTILGMKALPLPYLGEFILPTDRLSAQF